MRQRAVAAYRAAGPKPVIRQMARELGVHHEALRNWIRLLPGERYAFALDDPERLLGPRVRREFTGAGAPAAYGRRRRMPGGPGPGGPVVTGPGRRFPSGRSSPGIRWCPWRAASRRPARAG
ncbi:transposase [Kitasatospora sp. NPDC048722]|uniref:transposase n=1 Tax=Kitasatospora sp. NPDC048722 TaxID=3155639 RepID=UPI0034100CC5